MLSKAGQQAYLLWVHAVPVHRATVVSRAQREGTVSDRAGTEWTAVSDGVRRRRWRRRRGKERE